VGGPPRGDWAKGLCNCWETLGGIKAFGMACCWPLCGPCLYSKISARSSMPGTSWEKLGDSPFKQWFRLTLILVLVYWFASWGESMMTPDKPHFNAVANSDAEIKDFKKMENLTEAAIVDAVARMNPNITVAADLAALDKNVTESLEDGEAAVQKTVVDDASEMWLGSKEDLDAVADVGDFPEIEQAMPEEVISPAQQFFATLKWLVGVVWLVMCIFLRAHTRKRFDIDAKCCNCKLAGDINCEDIWCTMCCQPCVLSQMATHAGAVTNDQPCDCCDTNDPGESEHCVVPLDDVSPPQTANSMEREKGAMV